MCFGGDGGVLSWLGRLMRKLVKCIEAAVYVSFEFDIFVSNVRIIYFLSIYLVLIYFGHKWFFMIKFVLFRVGESAFCAPFC